MVFCLVQEWVLESGLVDPDDDLDSAIQDLWNEKMDKQEEEYLEYQNYKIIREDLHKLLQQYPHGSDLSKMSRVDQLRLDHLMYHYDRLVNEANALRKLETTESGMFESHIERESIIEQYRKRKSEL
eukprot:c19463_g1_i4.p2 GENE.c19463_g1_i4~~c19463_g1_i4.p2  ORF type:complete len:127 (+),score=34.95 c19463_g1_i4:781-1161(+)